MTEWIKISEKQPPNIYTTYLVTILEPETAGSGFFKKIPEKRKIGVFDWHPKEVLNESTKTQVIYDKVWGFHDFVSVYKNKIIAWMPLPDVYHD